MNKDGTKYSRGLTESKPTWSYLLAVLVLVFVVGWFSQADAQTYFDVEPNSTCGSAQDLRTAVFPIRVEGYKTSNPLDAVDFYKFSAPPGAQVRITLNGDLSKPDPLTAYGVGFFCIHSSENFTIAVTTVDLGNIDTKVYTTSLDYAVSLMDLSTQAGADDALATLDAALFQVNNTRSGLGAIQSRVTLTIASLSITSENLSASDSRIRDVDFAEETAVFTKNSIMTQAATAILAQANQLPQLALQLLG